MNQTLGLRGILFSPLVPLILYLAQLITTLHHEVPLLMSIHLELILFVLVVGFSALYILGRSGDEISYKHPLVLPLILGVSYATTPLLSSFAGQDQLMILDDGEYKSLVKTLIFGAFVFYFIIQNRYQEIILNFISAFYFILGIYFLYRFFILNEAREYDLRPTLHIRHGDPNFLCTFFAMMLPIAWLQGQRALELGQTFRAFLFSFLGLFFIVVAYITESRMGIIALLLGLGFLAIYYLRKSKHSKLARFSLVSVMLVASGLGFFQTSLFNRFSEINDNSSLNRLLTYENGLKVFSENPIFGSGMHKAKDFFYENSQYPHFQSDSKRLAVHNTFLSILAELGVVGFVAFFALLVWVLFRIIQSKGTLRVFLLASFIILFMSSLTVGLSYKDLILLHLFVLAGLAKPQLEVST